MSEGIGDIRGTLIIGSDLKGLDAGAASLKGLGGGADEASAKIGGLGKASSDGVQATVDLGNATQVLAEGVGRAAAAVGDAVVQAADYGVAITNIGTLSAETNARLGEYETGILSVSAALGQDATNSAKAAYDALSSGIEAGKAVEFLGVAGKAATAGLTTMDAAGKALTVTLNSFNLGASEATAVSDAMFAAANVGVTTFDELAGSFGGVASIASASGADYKETLAVLAQITTKGVGTSEAVTQMKAAFTALSKPTEDVKASLQAAGFASAEAAIKQKGLAFVLDLVKQTSVDTGKPLIELVGSTEAVNAILTTTGDNAEQTASKIATLQSSAGSTAAAFDLISETPAQKMAVLKSSVNNLVITLGSALLPVLGALLDGLNPLIQGLTRFASGVLGPLSAAFSALPGPIRIVIAGMAGLVVAGIALTGAVIGLQLAFGPAIAAIGTAGGVSDVASLGFKALGTAATNTYAAIAPLLLPLAALVGLVALVGGSLHAATKAWDEQKQAAVEAGGSYDAFALAAARAREESGLLAKAGFVLKDSFSEAGDEFTIWQAKVTAENAQATASMKAWWAGLTGGDEAKQAAEKAQAVNEAIAKNKQVTIDAGAAFLELGTNMSPAVRESGEFQLAQAQLNERFRDGDITAAQYKTQLLQLADSTSKAAGAGAVLTKSQQEFATSQSKSLDHMAQYSLGLSDAQRQSTGYQATLKALSEGVAQGTIEYADAASAMRGYASNQVAATQAAESALRTYGLTADGLSVATRQSEEFKDEIRAQAEAVAAGAYGLDEAQKRLQAFGQQMDAAKEQGFGLSSALQNLGLQQIAPDDEDGLKDLESQMQKARDARASLISEMFQAEEKFAADRAGLVSDNAQRLADAEAKAQESIAKAEKSGNAERIAEAQADAAKRVAEVRAENDQRLIDLQSNLAAEQAERKKAIAQRILDETQAALLSGKIDEERYNLVVGTVRKSFGDLNAIDPGAELQAKLAVTTSRLINGNKDAALAASAELTTTFSTWDAQMDHSAAAVEDAGKRADASYATQMSSASAATQAVNENTLAMGNAAAGSVLLAEGMNAGAQAAADGFAVIPAAANNAAGGVAQADADMRAAADLTTANLQANAGQRNATREAELQQQIATGGGIRSDLALSGAASQAWAGTVQQSAGQAGQAHAGFAQQASTAGQQVSQVHGLMQGEMATTGTIASGSIGGISKTYTGAAADIKSGGEQIVESAGAANAGFRSLGEGIPAAVGPGRTSIQGLNADMQELGDSASRISDSRVEGEEGAADAAKTAGDDTVTSFRDQTKAGQDLQRQVEDLRKAFEGLPKKLDIPVALLGADKMQQTMKDVLKDLATLGKGANFVITGRYVGTDGAEKKSPMAVLTDVRALMDEASNPFTVFGSYQGTGAMGWSQQGLALQQALSGLGKGVNPFVLQAEVQASAEFQRLLFDQATIQQNLADTNAEYFRLTRQIEEMGQAITRAGNAAEGARQAIQGALQGFFQGGGLDKILAQFKKLKIELGSDFFVQAGILDASTFADVQRQIAALAGEPEKQQDLWDALIDGLTNRWKVYYETLSNQEERLKSAKEREIREAKRANPEADTSALEKELEAINYRLELLKDQNEDVTNAFRDQTFQVGAQYDAWGRVNDALEDQQKIQRDLEAKRDKAKKDAEDALKAAQKLAQDAENDAHERTIDNIEDEIARRKAQRDAELEQFERRVKAEERLLESRRQAEDEDHEARMAAITAEVDAERDRIDQEEARIDRANTLLDIFKNGITPLTQEQKDYLASLGIDVESLTKANSGLAETKSLLDQINKAISDLPEDKPTRGTLSESQKAALQKAKDAGLISPEDQRVVDVALAGRSVRLDKIREILEGTTGSLEDQTQEQEDQASLAEQILKDLKLQLDLRKQSNDEARAALEGDIAAENKRHEIAKEHLGDELAALKEQQAAAKEKWDQELDALDQAKKAEEDRHKARMAQLQEEYALELLKLGKTDEEIKSALAEQAQRAKTIADEAQRRFEEWLQEVERLRQEAAARESQAPPAPPDPGPPPPSKDPGQEPITAPAPVPPGLPGPIPPPTTDSFLMKTLADAIELKSVMSDLAGLGFKAPNNFTVNQNTVNNNNRTFGDVTVLDGSKAEEALLDALGRN